MYTNDQLRHRRYARDILALQDGLTFRHLLQLGSDRAIYRQRRPSGLVTLGLRTDQLSGRYLMGIQGFRLAQYLELGWVSEQAIAAAGMFCEPTSTLRDDDVHVVTLSPQGLILGCLSVTGSPDRTPRRLDDRTRSAFPVEKAYGIDLLGALPVADGSTSAQVRELRRFVHRRSLTDRTMRLRVTLELLLAIATIGLRDPSITHIIGDVQEHVALRHLKIAGFRIRLVDGAHARVDAHDYLYPGYAKRHSATPFVAEVRPVELARRMARFEEVLSAADLGAGIRGLITDSAGAVQRVAATPREHAA